MDSAQESNYHFKKVVEGLPKELIQLLGQGLQTLADRRGGNEVVFAAPLNKALIKLFTGLLDTKGSNLNPQQRLALCSGLLGDSIELKSKSGQRVIVDLVSTEIYQQLLQEIANESQAVDFLLYPLSRMRALASGSLKPLNLDRPGRYREPKPTKPGQPSLKRLQTDWLEPLENLKRSQLELGVLKHDLLNIFSSERIGGVLAGVAKFEKVAESALAAKASLNLVLDSEPVQQLDQQALDKILAGFEQFSSDIGGILDVLNAALQSQHSALANFQYSSLALQASGEVAPETKPEAVTLKPGDGAIVITDMKATNEVMTQCLKQSSRKSEFLFTKMLLAEQTEGLANPGLECYASPKNLIASIRKINAIQPNCFPQDSTGLPQMPPVVIEPGAGVVRWLDDRFLLGFVSNGIQLKGPKVSFSALDLSVVRMFGLFMARGELFDYRGNRISGNFMADYSSQIETKAVAKFAGKSKKLTYTTYTEEKDAASRDDAVNDYIEFLYLVLNGLPIPKKISPRKVSVLLRYCIIKDIRFTARLVLKYVPGFDELVARELLTNLGGKKKRNIVDLIKQALESDPVMGNKYQHSIDTALLEVMGRDFAQDAKAEGLLGVAESRAPAGSQPVSGAVETNQEPEHDFFDV